MKNKEKSELTKKKVKANRGQFGVRIVATILALLMLLSVCGTLIYYFISVIK